MCFRGGFNGLDMDTQCAAEEGLMMHTQLNAATAVELFSYNA